MYKLVYCAIKKIEDEWTMPLRNWALTISQIDIFFPGRLKETLR
nr:hypothetical protein [Cardinium endosymbiont of Oedothorax gibbosus]